MWRFLSALLLVLCVVSAKEDFERQEDILADGVIPGLGAVEAEGSAGASLVVPPSHALSSSWEGAAEIDPKWNQELIEQRAAIERQTKREQLKRAIMLQKAVIEAQESKEHKLGVEAEAYQNELIDTPEIEVEDGYVQQGDSTQVEADCADAKNDDPESMTIPNIPPPPLLVKRYAEQAASLPSADALKQIPVVDENFPGESSPILSNAHPDEATQMPKSQFQNWALAREGEISPETPSATTHVMQGLGQDTVGIAADKAHSIVSAYFNADELENKEGGLDRNTAWGVMNLKSNPGVYSNDEVNEEAVSPSETPVPSASPSPLPREIYLQQPGVTRKEIGDLSFGNLLHVSKSAIMKNAADEAEHSLEVLQPTEQAVQRSFVGIMPHAATITPSESGSGLTGMGKERNALIPEMLIQTSRAMLMNRSPRHRSS